MNFLRTAQSASVLLLGLTLNNDLSAIDLQAAAHVGGVGVRHHYVQFGKDGSKFNYRDEGGQNIVFPYGRFAVTLKNEDDTRVVFQYVPLEFATQAVLNRDVTIDGATFPLGTNMNLRYSFPFYRIGYEARIGDGENPIHLGAALQVRNASITFAALDGSLLRTKQNVGPVPLLTAGWHCKTCVVPYFARIATMYAPVKYINGSDSDVVGAFTDFETGMNWTSKADPNNHLIMSFGYLGGGARGTNTRDVGYSDGFSSNWIDLVFFSLGLDRAI